MGNHNLCAKDTRIQNPYLQCGRQSEFRNSTAINIINQIPVVHGPPLNFQKQQTFKKVERSAAQFCETNNLDYSLAPIIARIIAFGHSNIFRAYQNLPYENKEMFLQEIRFVDFDFLDSVTSYRNIRSYITTIYSLKKKYNKKLLYPKILYIEAKSNKIRKDSIQKQDIAPFKIRRVQFYNNIVGFIIMCAGSSSRFTCNDKFLVPLQLKNNKTLLEIMLGRIRRNFKVRQGEIANVPILIACNNNNRYVIETFLKQKKYCGFEPQKIRYMAVPPTPILDKKGKICLSFQFKVVHRPGGTARCIQQLFNSQKNYNFFKSQQVQILHIVGCQNLAQNPGDPFMLGYLEENKLQMIGKCTNAEYPTQNFPRYLNNYYGKTVLAGTEQILKSNIAEKYMETLLQDAPIAMNSIVCKLNDLKKNVKDFNNSIFLSQQYRALQRPETYFNFEKEKPEINQNVFVFQKDIGHLLTCSKKCVLIKVCRENFIPLITKRNEYSIKQSCLKLLEAQQKISTISTQSNRNSNQSL